MYYSNMCANCEQQSNKIVQFRISPLLIYLANLEQCISSFLETVIIEMELQIPAVLIHLCHGTIQHQLVKRLH
jgi:hypothetical protein